MTAQLLTSELSTLLQEAKRKNPELRSAVEKSLSDLKALPRTSEAQIAADLKARPIFLRPFLLASKTRNGKFAGSAIVCLLRLIVVQALGTETLPDVLEALKECSTLALDIQLKVLQAVPSLLQNYAISLTGHLLTAIFQVSFLLYSSKTAVVSNTAAATLQQLVNSTFERAGLDRDKDTHDGSSVEISTGNNTTVISGLALDTHQLLEDLCLMTEGSEPKTLQDTHLAQSFGLELLTSILSDYTDMIVSRPELIQVIRIRLIPLVIKLLSEKTSFPLTVRTMRLSQLILGRLVFALATECEMILSLLNHMLDPDAAVLWKRALCLELFRGLHSESALFRSMYTHYDEDDNNRNIVRDHLGCLVRLASEKPHIIGLSQQSSVPTLQADDSGEQAAMQAGGFIGTIGASIPTFDLNTPGISSRWSIIRIPCLDMLDKADPPPLPATYVYSLTLICITSFSEGIARFLLPFTVPIEGRSKRRHTRGQDRGKNGQFFDNESPNQDKSSPIQITPARRVPVNPLVLKEHPMYDQILTSAKMVDQCWPALLAASSTFLNASMDSEHYHTLIRSFQKFTQIAGLLDLRTPRDAFLTTLGKHAIPYNAPSRNLKSVSSPVIASSRDSLEQKDGHMKGDIMPLKPPMKRQQTSDSTLPVINTRHLLCLRALLNLGIALGPFLSKAWSIILETLQQVEMIANVAISGQSQQNSMARRKVDTAAGSDDAASTEDLALEIVAAETAASRLFESTIELPSSSFLDLLECLFALLRPHADETIDNSPGGMKSPGSSRKHQRIRSISGTSMETSAVEQERIFIIEKLQQVIRSNTPRLLQADLEENGWDLIFAELRSLIRSLSTSPEVRVKSAIALNEMLVLAAISESVEGSASPDHRRTRSLEAIVRVIESLESDENSSSQPKSQCEMEIHARALDATRSILEQCGDTLRTGWVSVFAIINSIFDKGNKKDTPPSRRQKSVKLIRSSFGSLQLICSDFLTFVPLSSVLRLLDTLYIFSAQDQDFNISLTTATLFQNVSDFLLRDLDELRLSPKDAELLGSMDSSDDGGKFAGEGRTPLLWLYLLSRLVQLSIDGRLEVRHSVLRTIFGIFNEKSSSLSGSAVTVCFRSVFLALLVANEERYTQAKTTSQDESDELALWNQTAVILLQGMVNVFSLWLESSKIEEEFVTIFEQFLNCSDRYLQRESLLVSKASYAGIAKILSDIDETSLVSESSLQKCWKQWMNNNPAAHTDDSARNSGNQDTLIAYVGCVNELLRLTKDKATTDLIEVTLVQLKIAMKDCSASMYTSDLDTMTPLQRSVLETLKRIPTSSPQAATLLLRSITTFIGLAYGSDTVKPRGTYTYLALSKASMSLLESFLSHHTHVPEIDMDFFLTEALQALAKPIHLKYHCYLNVKAPSPWRKATATAVSVLKSSRTILEKAESNEAAVVSLWEAVVHIVDGIIGGDSDTIDDAAMLRMDEEEDIKAFRSIRSMIIPEVGSVVMPAKVRRLYVESVFRHSLIHEPHPDDLARSGQQLLDGLDSDHIGRVQDLPATTRAILSYLLLDELFDLVGIHNNSAERLNLSQAAIPYLVLRAGLTLKAYIYDQPLRGFLPQPWSQRREMQYLLGRLIHLDPGARSLFRSAESVQHSVGYLQRLFLLLMSSLRVASGDEEMEEAIRKTLEAIGSGFEL